MRAGGAAEAWTIDQAYEPYIGRWSWLAGARFPRWLPADRAAAWCDVGCGTGALALANLATEEPTPPHAAPRLTTV